MRPHRPLSLSAALLSWSSLSNAQSQPNPCFRWSGQMAIANSPSGGNSTSTLWYYGGEVMNTSTQDSNLWTNALLSLDLTKDWGTGTPAIKLVQADNGNYSSPPAVALGALWASADGSNLYQYAGQFQDTPAVSPPEQEVYAYSIADNEWSVVPTKGDTVTRPAEGLVGLVPELGTTGDNVGYFFGGHLDDFTVEGWSNQVARVYLDSLVSFDLGTQTFTNITSFSSNATSGGNSAPESAPVHRADGVFVYVPGLGTEKKGIIVAIGGATETQFVDNSVLDVYDIGSGGWTKQSTLGDTMSTRVNHCAVRASAKVDGVLTNQIYIYGGQRLNQTDRDSAMYILNIQDDDWTWVHVGDDLSGQPSGRAGHQCALQGNQMIVIGGVVADDILCDTPGIYVYNVSSSAWQSSYKAGSTYSTPSLIANITGGIGTGGSSSGAGSATGGDGSSFPDTSGSTSGDSGSGNGSDGSGDGDSNGGGSTQDGSGGGSKSNVGAIAGGVVGGVVALVLLALLALFLMRRRKRERQLAEAQNARDKLPAPLRSNSGSSDGRWGTPYEKQGARSADHSSGTGQGPASDDVEEETRGMEATFGSSHLVPRQQLRVMNPED